MKYLLDYTWLPGMPTPMKSFLTLEDAQETYKEVAFRLAGTYYPCDTEVKVFVCTQLDVKEFMNNE